MALNDSQLCVIVPTMNLERYIDLILEYFKDNGISVIVFVDSKSTPNAGMVAGQFFEVRPIRNDALRVGEIIEDMSRSVNATWVLRIDDDELPSRAMMDYVAKAICTDEADVYGFPRHQCAVSRDGQLLRDAGHCSEKHRQWRLYRPDRVRFTGRGHTSGFEFDGLRWVAAPEAACMIHLDWAVHSYEERKAKIARYDAHTPNHGSAWRRYYLYEEDGLARQRLEPVDLPEFSALARNISVRLAELCLTRDGSRLNQSAMAGKPFGDIRHPD